MYFEVSTAKGRIYLPNGCEGLYCGGCKTATIVYSDGSVVKVDSDDFADVHISGKAIIGVEAADAAEALAKINAARATASAVAQAAAPAQAGTI